MSSDAGSTWETIATSTDDDESHPWTVPSMGSSLCRIKVSDTDGMPSALSDTFAIAGISVTSPSVGENLIVGTTEDIRWTSYGAMGQLKIDINRDASWSSVADSISDDGAYEWLVSGDESPSAVIRVSDVDGSPAGTSEAFAIREPSISVVSPGVGETWMVGTTEEIRWISEASLGNVQIKLSRNGGTSWELVTDSTSDTGTCDWQVEGDESSNAMIRVSDEDGSPSSESQMFTIALPAPEINISSTNLALSVVEGGSVDTVIVVGNEGDATLQVTSVTDDSNWLSEDPTTFDISAESSQDVTVTADATGLSVGQYSGTITVPSNDPDEAEVTVSVSLNVLPPPTPDISVSPANLALSVFEGGSVDTVIVVGNEGDARLEVTAVTDDAGWLDATPTDFTVSAASNHDVTLTADATSLSAGQYSTTITIGSDDPDEAEVMVSVDLTVRTVVVMVSLPGGTYQMGSDNSWAYWWEQPVHSVTISAFSIAKYEVTNEEMREVMQWAYDNGKVDATSTTVTNLEGDSQELLDLDGRHREIISYSGGTFTVENGKEDHPCIEVTWYGGQAFCNYMSDMEGLERSIDFHDWSCTFSASGYRLPTEGEWEYACRSGTTTDYYSGSETESGCDHDANLDLIGWYCGNDNRGTAEVGGKAPSDWGLYDMSGNVWEWCNDWWDADYYEFSPTQDPPGPTGGSYRVVRGGSWYFIAEICRSADRYSFTPDYSIGNLGFRPARRLFGF